MSERGVVVAIGGLGGSGTRVVTEIVNRLGIYIGWDLNKASDNLLFTALFKTLHRSEHSLDAIQRLAMPRLELFRKLMLADAMTIRDAATLARAFAILAVRGNDHQGSGRGSWGLKRLIHISQRPKWTGDMWGWKEPNTHIFLPAIAEHFPNASYVHVIRHGVDMAFSANDAQLRMWGRHFGVPVPSSEGPALHRARLHYWVLANMRAHEIGTRLLGDRFLPVRFDDLCREPATHVAHITNALGVSVTTAEAVELAKVVRPPDSLKRHDSSDLEIFDGADLEAVARLGFHIG